MSQTDDLFTRLGLAGLSDQDKLAMSEDLGEAALARIAARLEELLTPEQKVRFETELGKDEAAAFTLLRQYVPDYPEIAREEIERLRAEILDTHDSVMSKLNQRDR